MRPSRARTPSTGGGPTRGRLSLLLAATLLFILVRPVDAHSFYLDARWVSSVAGHDGSPLDGARVDGLLLVDVRVGHAFRGEPLPRMAEHVRRFVLVDRAGRELPLAGVAGRAPAGFLEGFAGPGLVVYESHGVDHRLERRDFERYAEEEGVRHLLDALEPSASGFETESFHRCAKAQLETPGSAAIGRQPTGCTLELVPAGPPGSFRVLLRGEPLALALVQAWAADGRELRARTDVDGSVQFALGSGRWMLSAVHLEPSGATEGPRWSSWWSSYVLATNGGR